MVTDLTTRRPALGSPEAGRLGGLTAAFNRREREKRDGGSLTLPARIRSSLVNDTERLRQKTREAIDALPVDRPVDHRALASALVALAQTISELTQGEGGAAGAEPYEQTIERLYRARGATPPGRRSRAAQAQEAPSPPSPIRGGRMRRVTPTFDEKPNENITDEET